MTAEVTCKAFEITDGELTFAKQHEQDRNLVACERVAARWVQITVRRKRGITKSKRMRIATARKRFREFASLSARARIVRCRETFEHRPSRFEIAEQQIGATSIIKTAGVVRREFEHGRASRLRIGITTQR